MSEINLNELRPNSNKYKRETGSGNNSGNREKLKSVVKEGVVSSKKPISQKFAETFMGEDVKDVKTWLVMDVIIPGIKNTILDLLQMMFFGEVSSRGRSNNRRNERSNYRSYYGGSRSSNSSRRSRDVDLDDDDVSYKNIVLKNRQDAENVIEEMRDRIDRYGEVSIADMFDLVGVNGKYTDNNWGWKNERDIGIRRVSNGYLIDVSEPRCLD